MIFSASRVTDLLAIFYFNKTREKCQIKLNKVKQAQDTQIEYISTYYHAFLHFMCNFGIWNMEYKGGVS